MDDYYISYKGKLLLKAMTEAEAQKELKKLSECLDGLEIVVVPRDEAIPHNNISLFKRRARRFY